MIPADATATLERRVDRFFAQHALPPGSGLVAFSGGPDSTALLRLLATRARREGAALHAAHLDHALDPGSARRARAAERLAAAAGVPLVVERREVPRLRRAGESVEAAARRVRYRFLGEAAHRLGASWVATAHHRDDQAETVLLRLAAGSGWRGLAGIRPVRRLAGGILLVRPLLELRREELAAALADVSAETSPVEDPTNRDLALPRNRIRHLLLPALAAEEATAPHRIAAVAAAARRAGEAVDRRLAEHLAPRPLDGGLAVPRAALAALPAPLLPAALSLLHRHAGAPYPAGRDARRELARQLAAERGAVGCDCGGGWRWEARGELVALLPPGAGAERGSPSCAFSYTLAVPGELEIPELGCRLTLDREPPAPWMVEGAPHRAALALPLADGDRVTVRTRRPGDRLRPLGARGSRRLKEVLIDRRVPRGERDRLPLLCLGEAGETIAWVPGVTIDERFRLPEPLTGAAPATVWVAGITGASPARPPAGAGASAARKEPPNAMKPRDDAAEHHDIETVVPADRIASRVAALGRQLTDELPDDALLVSLLGGSVIFLADLVRAIQRPLRYEFLHVEASGEGDEESVLALHYPIPFSVREQSVLLLKDVVNTGTVEQYLTGQLRDHGAREVRLAALVDIPMERRTEISVDYHAFRMDRHGILVGYGLKHAGGHGNLPFIGQLPAAP